MKTHILKFGDTSMKDHHSWKKVLETIKEYQSPVVLVSATEQTTSKLTEAAELSADGNMESARRISAEIKSQYVAIIESFLKENPHPKTKLITESCLKKIDAKIGKLEKLLFYIQKQGTLSAQMQDSVTSLGAQISSYLLAQGGLALDVPTQHIEARKIIKTDAEYGKANPNQSLIAQKCESLETILENGFIPVIGAFYGEAPNGTTTTLSAEGADNIASIMALALNAKVVDL